MKEIKVGEIFDFQGKKLRVEEDLSDDDCKDCFGNIWNCDTLCTKFCCISEERSDKTSVVFVETKEN